MFQGCVEIIPKMFNIRNQSREATVNASTCEGYDIGVAALAKGAGFRRFRTASPGLGGGGLSLIFCIFFLLKYSFDISGS
jgi:hypothetical protein